MNDSKEKFRKGNNVAINSPFLARNTCEVNVL